VGGGERGM